MWRKEYLIDSLMNLTSDGLILVDVNGKVLEVNKKFEELHGWKRDEVVGTVLPMVPDQYKDEVFKLYQSLLDGAQHSDFEAIKLRKDGSTFHANVTVSPVKDEQGTVIGFIGVERDITEKKRAEEELLEREKQYRKLIKLNPEPIVLHMDGIIQFVNDVGCKLLGGHSTEDYLGASVYDFFYPKDWERVRRRTKQVLESDEYTEFMEFPLRRIDGVSIDVELSSIYVHRNLGSPVVQTVIRDITQRKKSEEMIIRAEKLSLIGELAAGIAHDIRNPLTSLKGFVQLLKAKNTDYVQVMLEELEHINYVVNEFMTLAKPHLNHFMESQVQPLLESVVHFMMPQARLYNVQIQIEMYQDIPAIQCIPDQIKQVLINLLKNAIESMPQGGVIQVTIRKEQNHSIRIYIQDQGSGISEDMLSRLGAPFVSTKTNGTGLGLMVCKRIIECHGGTLSFHSELNQGTSVVIELPMMQVTQQ
ncbi:PAS domain-containing sensor histidine kinase [Paenibacillus cremeus]|uniref:histidine kinase n=1 Tax=Paenibacillus cremeus TaxID=2163881 RepID=A0A559KGV3_9BACL|nr:PAS domain-containing sensor histidine kinase [Paenibacillus cremeus]TVY11359.1 PAS domain S-box protein [Paenibacillus cremeus]